jgi:hypothetical protein
MEIVICNKQKFCVLFFSELFVFVFVRYIKADDYPNRTSFDSADLGFSSSNHVSVSSPGITHLKDIFIIVFCFLLIVFVFS